jgi:hypothetical protein
MNLFKNVTPCHCEPFALCHSERSEESHTARGKLRMAIHCTSNTTKILQSLRSLRMTGKVAEIATSLTLLAMTGRGTGLVASIRARNPAPRNDENARIKQGVESCS